MDRIAERLSRLRRHPNLSALYESLPYHTREIVEGLLESGATYPLMEKASECMDEEFQEYAILQILANGNVFLLDSVTDVALDELEYLLSTLDEDE